MIGAQVELDFARAAEPVSEPSADLDAIATDLVCGRGLSVSEALDALLGLGTFGGPQALDAIMRASRHGRARAARGAAA